MLLINLNLNYMVFHTKICIFDKKGFPIHLCDLNGLIPNMYVGMQLQVKNKKYKVKDISVVVDLDFCRQIIQVVDYE